MNAFETSASEQVGQAEQAEPAVHLDDVSARANGVSHPLDPLSAGEIEEVTRILQSAGSLTPTTRVVSIALHEPEKAAVLSYQSGGAFERQAEVIVLDRASGTTYEGRVSLSREAVDSWRDVPGVQPAITGDEFFECERIVKADPRFQEAARKRGVTDMDLVLVDPWSAGFYGDESEQGRRLVRALAWVRSSPGGNAYAHPIENVAILVDLNAQEVVRVDDFGVVPVPKTPGEYASDLTGPARDDLRPIEIQQPEGTSFAVNGNEVRWQKWHFRVGFNPREGLVLHTIGYHDGERLRSILYRASLSEMVVPYGDPADTQWRKNAFDAGEYNIGTMANSLELGCDCLGAIHYFDVALAGDDGRPRTLANAICMHEEDFGILWKHVDFRTNAAEVRRSRRLVVSWIATVGNYDYGFFWYFYQDGNIEFEVKLTGIVSTGVLAPGASTSFGQKLSPDGLYAPIHQHFFSVRLDFDVDGPRNSVYEVHTEAVPPGPENPHGNAYLSKSTRLSRESDAQRTVDSLAGRYWKIVNEDARNLVGEPTAYKLMPKANTISFAQPDASIRRRAGFIAKNLWVTPYQPEERYAAGDYPNQHPGGEGLPKWTAADRSVEETDVVVWYTLGSLHPVRLEDWPVMPVQYAGFMLQPSGFFDSNPALDVPDHPHKHHHHHNGHGAE